MAYKFACLAAVLLSLYVSAVVAQTCSEQVLGGIRGIDANVDFSSSQVLPRPLLIEFDDRYLGQGWPVLTIDSLTQPTVFRQLDCSRVELFEANCNDADGDYRLEQVDNVDPTIVVGSELGYLLGGNRVAFSDINCQSAVVATAKLETSLDISLGSFSISGSNEDGANECQQDSGLVYEFDSSVNVEPWAGRGFILTFRDFELGKVNLLAEISILTGDGAISESFVLDDRAVRGTSFFFAWSEFPGAAEGLRNFLGLSLVFKGVVDDDYGISLFSTFSHFVTGNLNAGCEGSINECVTRPGCVATLTGFDVLFDESVQSTFAFSSDYQAEGIADEDAFAVLPFNTFDWLRYVTCHSSGYFWFQLNPGVYTVSVDCNNEEVQRPDNSVDFCVALGDNDIFDIDSSVDCGNRAPEFADIVCLDSRETDDGPYCERSSSSDIDWPQDGFFNLDDEFVKCINFPFVITDIGLELECSVPDKDCAEDWPEPDINARDPVCDTVIEPELVSETHEGDTCEETTTWVYRATNGPLTERCTVTSTSTDTTAPEWTVRPSGNKRGACSEQLSFDNVDAADDCSETIITEVDDSRDNRCRRLRTRTWSLVDGCGNEQEETLFQRLTLDDIEPPVFDCPADYLGPCDEGLGNLDPSVTGRVRARDVTDDCQSDFNITFTDGDSEENECEPCESGLTRTWTVDDGCQDPVSCEQKLRVTDDEAPELEIPGNTSVECGESSFPENTGSATACDNCDKHSYVFYTDRYSFTCECDTCLYETRIRRRWGASDNCENSVVADSNQVITREPCPPCEKLVESCKSVCQRTTRNYCNACSEADSCSLPGYCNRVNNYCHKRCVNPNGTPDIVNPAT